MDVTSLKKYIYDNNKIEFILNDLKCWNIKYHRNKEYYSACQPDGDNEQGVNIRNNEYLNYRSFSRDVSYDDNEDLISLVQTIKGMSFIEALKYLHNILNLEYSAYSIKKKEKNKILSEVEKAVNPILKHITKRKYIDVSDIETLDEDLLNDYVPMLFIDWFKEGIAPWAREKFGLMYSYRYKRVVIPHRYWMTGELVGTNMRTVVENYNEFGIKKFYITPTYKKHLNLYGLWENMETIQKAGYVVVVEGEKSVLKRYSLLDGTLVALSGKTMSEEQARILLGLNVEIIIALDNDVPIEETWFMCEKFYNKRKVSYIRDKDNILGEKDSVADTDIEDYKYLFENRITYGKEQHDLYNKSLEKK